MENKLEVQVGDVRLKNPLIAASGTMGFGREASLLYDPAVWGGIASKAVTVEPRIGNATPRVAEAPCGMLNSVGLQNPGLAYFLEKELPFMKKLGPCVIVNAAGQATDEYLKLTEALSAQEAVEVIELNLSCPNVTEGCMSIRTDPAQIEELVSQVRKRS